MGILTLFSLVSGIGFIGYGVQCLRSPFMISEFQRFGQARYRTLTGILEILGGLGVLVGLYAYPLGLASSAGLCILMAMGLGVRIRIGDTVVQCLPAFFFCILNALIFFLHARPL